MNQKGFANIILAAVIVVLISAVGYFVFVKKSEPIIQQPTPTSEDETTNWKTYNNATYNYQFKYPQEFEKYLETSEKIFLQHKLNSNITFNVFVNATVGFDEGFDQYKPSRSVVVGGILSEISFTKSRDGQLFISSFVNKGGNSYMIYMFTFGNEQEVEKIFTDILLTFKFMN